jgi:membrane protein required for colicin V production
MNAVDGALLVLLALFALRGFWRGFFRESFGLVALVVGIGGALRYTETLASILSARFELPGSTSAPIAFVGIFMACHTVLNLFGFVLDRTMGTGFSRGLNRMVGALFGVGKGAAILAFALLFLRLFPVLESVDRQIMSSRVARPLASAAGTAIRAAWEPADTGEPKRA